MSLRANVARRFWSWFAASSDRLLASPGEAIADELFDQLKQVDGRLGVEVSDPSEHGDRELIITAFADRQAMPIAVELVSEAPPLRGWRLVGLRPPGGFDFSFEKDDVRVSGRSLRFVRLTSNTDPAMVGVRLHVPVPLGDLDASTREQLGWQLLGAGLGELLSARIDHLEVLSGDDGEPIDALAPWLEQLAPAGN